MGKAGGCRAAADDSPGVVREVENDDGMSRQVARKGVETADAGSLPSRRRVSTGGAEDPLPIARLPERDARQHGASRQEKLLLSELSAEVGSNAELLGGALWCVSGKSAARRLSAVCNQQGSVAAKRLSAARVLEREAAAGVMRKRPAVRRDFAIVRPRSTCSTTRVESRKLVRRNRIPNGKPRSCGQSPRKSLQYKGLLQMCPKWSRDHKLL
jgi:hypothetical protein